MKQNKNWMNCLIIGIFGSLIISSCGKTITDYNYEVDHVYVNQTGHDLIMEVYNDNIQLYNYNIVNEDSVNTHTSSGDGLGLFYYESNVGDSVIVRFDNNKCLLYQRDLRNGPFIETSYDNYSDDLIQPGGFTLYYTFTVEDYNLAVDCN